MNRVLHEVANIVGLFSWEVKIIVVGTFLGTFLGDGVKEPE